MDLASFVRSGNRKSWIDVADARWENLGPGWHGVESFPADPAIQYRWSKQEAVVYLWNPFDAGRITIEALCPGTAVQTPSVFFVSINGEPLARVEVGSSQWEEVSLGYSAAVGPLEIRLRAEKTWHRDDRFLNADMHNLGIGFRRITLRPECADPAARSEISVVIPTYNRIDKLLSVLGALEAQTLDKRHFEVIVVDDGSSDGTESKVRQYAQSSSLSLRYFQQQHKLQGAARNLGIRHATKPIILFLGDDIIPAPMLLEQHLLLHAKHGNNSRAAVLGYTAWAKHLRVTPFMRHIGQWGAQFGYALTKANAPLTFNFFYTSNVSVSREILQEQSHIFDEDFQCYGWEDTELAYRLERAGMQLWYNPRAVAYHDHPVTMREFCRRQYVVGRSSRLFARKHPSVEASLGLPDDLERRVRRGRIATITERAAGLADSLLGVRLPARYYELVLQRHYAAGALDGIKAEAAGDAKGAAVVSTAIGKESPSPQYGGEKGDRSNLCEAPEGRAPTEGWSRQIGPVPLFATDPIRPLRRTTKVHFYLHSGGNEFLQDIAEMFQDGFTSLGLETALRVDEIPDVSDPDVLRILVAPHELMPLFLERKLSRSRLEKVVGGCHLLCTEQPGSVWFEQSVKYAMMAEGVFDINRQAVRELRRRGVAAVYTPLGYTPLLEAVEDEPLATVGESGTGPFFGGETPLAARRGQSHFRGEPVGLRGDIHCAAKIGTVPCVPFFPPARDVDIVFLGHSSPKRDWFLAEHAERLQKYNCRLIFASLDRMRRETTKGYYARNRRNQLLRRSKILVNLHSSESNYFEWHRVLPCLANGCLVISEFSEDHAPLTAGEHLVLCRPEEIIDRCEHYLQHESERAAMAHRAYEFLRNGLGIEASCRTMCEQRLPPWERSTPKETYPLGGADLPAPASAPAVRLDRRAKAWARRALSACRRIAARQPHVRRAYFAAKSLYRRWKMPAPRVEDFCCETASDWTTTQQWECFPNSSYQDSPPPSVSVVVASHNDSRSIARCLKSIADCCRDRLPAGVEAIVVDDASADGSLEIAREAADGCGLPVRVVKKHRTTGPADVRNLGLELARAPYVLQLDADGWLYPTCIAKLYETITSSGADAAYAVVKQIDRGSGRTFGLSSQYDWDAQRLIAGPCLHGTALFDRARLLALGGYSRELAYYGRGLEDYDLWLKLAQAGYRCAFRAEILSAGCGDERSLLLVAADRLPGLIAHLEDKFAELLARHPAETVRFGRPVTVKIERLAKGQAAPRPPHYRCISTQVMGGADIPVCPGQARIPAPPVKVNPVK